MIESVKGEISVCSECFQDEGLRIEATYIGAKNPKICPLCGSLEGIKLDSVQLEKLAYKYFVAGSFFQPGYGGAPILKVNTFQKTNVRFGEWLKQDVSLISKILGIGIFRNAPPTFIVGDLDTLNGLRDDKDRLKTIENIIGKYSELYIEPKNTFYRVRREPINPMDLAEYDTPPFDKIKEGRLNTKEFPVLYASPDLEVCVHESRFAAEDELFVATLKAEHRLRMIDFSSVPRENDHDIGLTIKMLFTAASHSYQIQQEIAQHVQRVGYDGIVYPSYFSRLRTGGVPYGEIDDKANRNMTRNSNNDSVAVPNIAVFGYPIKEKKIKVHSINRIVMEQVEYRFGFGPVFE